MSTTRKVLVIAMAALLFASGVGASAGYTYLTGAKDGLRVHGRLQVVALHPIAQGGCEDPAAQHAATIDFLRAQARTVLEKLLLPSTAHADQTKCKAFAFRSRPNLIVNAGETALRDCFNANASSECTATVAVFKYHGLGTGTTAAAEANTGCETELTTQYNPDSTRATGSQTTNGANIYRTIGTNTIDSGTPAVTEWCLQKAATGAATMWSRVVFAAINLAANDSLQTTYDLTIE